MKISKTILLGCILYFASCSREAEKKQEQAVKADTILVEEDHHHDTNEVIELNNGTKWKVAEGMIAFIRIMETDVKLFSETKHSGMKDYTQLGVSLQKNIDSLTSNCTMTGKAHDELHKWLLPYIEMVDALNKSKNESDAAAKFASIEAAFVEFNTYFE